VAASKREPLILALRDLVKWMESERATMMIIGGLAVSLLGRARTTKDIDAVVSLPMEKWLSFVGSGAKFHFQPRIKNWFEFAQQSMVILLQHVSTGTPIDLSIGGTSFEQQALSHVQYASLKRIKVPLPRVSDLIVFKAIARRPTDWADIDGLLKSNKAVDQNHIQGWLHEFAEILADETIVTDYLEFVGYNKRR